MLVLLGGCVADGAATVAPVDLGARLQGQRLDLAVVDATADPSAGPMVMRLGRDGQGDMDYAGVTARYQWRADGDRLCLRDIRLGDLVSDGAEQCSSVTLDRDQIRMQGIGPGMERRRMAGTIRPL